MVIQIWIFGRQFLQNEQRETITFRKTTDSMCYQLQNLKSHVQMGTVENFISTSVSMTWRVFLMRLVGILTYVICDISTECATFGRSVQLREPVSSKCLIHDVTKSLMAKGTVQSSRWTNFNEMEYKNFIDQVPDSALKLIFKKLPFVFPWW